ncbi:hypothetical protein GCM10027290_41900 [Micromonospora sonneratiae]|uniref:SGNH/GDSL hydrolase family protein n=1 Tax=Micromonospora sonneratiae TaxID=1184706 RepID=A0ABW3YBN5_9ACTN
MRLPALTTVATLLAAGVLAIPGTATAQSTPNPATKIMVTGDSITQGSAGDYTWRHRLWKHLTANSVDVDMVGPNKKLYDNVHSTGGNLVESDAYADPAFDQDHNAKWGRFLGSHAGYPTGAADLINGDVLVYQPDYLIAALGINDLFWFSTRSPTAVANDMATLISNARAAKPDVRILLVAIPPTKAALDDVVLAGRVSEYNQRLATLAASSSTVTSPIAYAAPPADYQPDYLATVHDSYDGTHPNARGELRIAAAVADVLSTGFALGPPFSLTLTGVPVGPTIGFALRCTPGDGKATLDWDETPGATGYWYQRRVAGGQWEAQVYQLTLADRPLENPWLYNGVTYEYRLQAAKMYDKGIYSNVCSVTPSA